MQRAKSELMRRRAELLASIAEQRVQMSEIGSELHTPFLIADKGVAVARYFRLHPLLLAGFASFLVIRRRSVAALVWAGWRVFKLYRDFTSDSVKRLSQD